MRIEIRSCFFPSRRAPLVAGLAAAALLSYTPVLRAQDAATAPAAQTTQPTGAQGAQAQATPSNAPTKEKKKHHWIARVKPVRETKDTQGEQSQATLRATTPKKQKHHHIAKAERIKETKDTKKELKKEAKYNPLIGRDEQLPDKQLYDKAMAQIASGHYDVGRLDLDTLLDTYPDSQYMMRAKLAVADAWYKEGGSAAMTEAEQEYRDFITFFPNVPEAAEAQLRIGDIYFKQMDVPGRDYSKATHAEQEYRTMLMQYPDAPKPILDQARQRLREVQEVLADREASIGSFYAAQNNWPAAIARYQTVADTYPLYSHMDDVLIGIGDAYEAEAALVRTQPVCANRTNKPVKTVAANRSGKKVVVQTRCLPEGVKARLLEDYDGKAAADYRDVVLYHSAAPHVEDAKERLNTMNLPIPTPTKEEAALSEDLESSRAQYDLQKRIELMFLHEPNTVTAARIGLPPLQDPAPTMAPTVVKELMADYRDAYNPNARKELATAPTSASSPAEGTEGAAAAPPAASGAPTLENVPTEGTAAAENTGKTVTIMEPANSPSGTGVGIEVVSPSSNSPSGTAAAPSGTPASNLPAATGAQDPNYGLPMPKKTSTALPPVEKPAEAPDQINDMEGHTLQPVQPPPAATANGKKKKKKTPKIDKNDESSSKKKPKHGLGKLNPF